MKSKKIKFEFTPEEVQFVKRVQVKGYLEENDKQELKRIYQSRIDPSYDPCAGCHQVQKENFKRLVQIMCESLGVTDLIYYKPVTQESLKTQKGFNEALAKMQDNNKEEEPKKENFLQKLAKHSRI